MSTAGPSKRAPARRLGKINDPNPRFASPKGNAKGKAPVREATIRSPTPLQRTPTPQPRRAGCCENPNHEWNDDIQGIVCSNCFTQINQSNIVAEVEFDQDARGGHTLQGGFIGENARHASTMGQAATQIAGSSKPTAEQNSAKKFKEVMARIRARFAVNDVVGGRAGRLYDLALKMNFSAGRRTDEVVAACLYASCRHEEGNMVMLMDIAEALQQGVFRLGEVFKDLCKDLYIDSKAEPSEKKKALQNGEIRVVHVESLVLKYCRKLEFGSQTNAVADDAMKIISRMKRDWMVTGRHPAGLCGAAIVLAARMNNFRRSVREVVWVVKVTDMTIHKRMMEFRRSKSTALSVDEFRKFGVFLKDANDPPAILESKLKNAAFEAKKRKREEASMARDTVERDDGTFHGSIEDVVAGVLPQELSEDGNRRKRRRTTNGESSTPAQPQQEPRRDADGFAIPALPTSNTQAPGEQQERRKRGRPKKNQPPPIDLSEAELITEELLQNEIEYEMKGEEMTRTVDEVVIAKAREYAEEIAARQKEGDAERTRRRRQAHDSTWDGELSGREEVTAEELEKEFENDLEVQRCLLSEEEQSVKERIWIFNNEDWLRQQQEKKLIEAVAKAAGRNEKGKKPGKGAKKKRKGKMGDGTLLKNAREMGESPLDTPADTTGEMIKQKAPALSGFLHEGRLKAIFARNTPSSTSDSGSAQNGEEGTSDEASPPNAGAGAAQDDESSTRSTPVPTSKAPRMPSPPVTQRASESQVPADSPERERTGMPPPRTPPQTQTPAGRAGDDESEGDEDDYVQDDELDFGNEDESMGGMDDEEDDFGRALDPTNRLAVDDDAYGNDDYYSD